MCNDTVNWIIIYEDADVDNQYFSDEDTARKVYAEISTSWNAHLFKRVASNFEDFP